MENLVAILIGLIWLAFKYYRKSQKKDSAPRREVVTENGHNQYASSEEKEPEQEFEEYIEQFFGISKPKPEPKPIVETTPSWMEEGTAPEIEVPYDSIEYQDDEDLVQEIDEIKKQDITRRNNERSIIDDFDLEKAVVYSAILEPRQF